MSKDIDIENLAQLARIDIDNKRAESLKDSIADILDYVESVEEVAVDNEGEPEVGPVHNVMRADENPHDPDKYRDQLRAEASQTDNDFIVVPPIL